MSNNKGSRERCLKCGLKIRGSNHEKGSHCKAHAKKREKMVKG